MEINKNNIDIKSKNNLDPKKEQKKKINKRQTHNALKIGLHIKFQEKQKESEKIDIIMI